MFLLKSTFDVDNLLNKHRNENKKIGFVATMGALHKGHISLNERSKRENDTTVCSIFVNPRQFNETKDLENYPRPIENDIKVLIDAGCDLLFLPGADDIYPVNYSAPEIDLLSVAGILEGASRPGHFKGVAIVVKRLFDCVKPDKAYFGQKDYQQTLVIKQIIKQFYLPIEIVISEIVREDTGLAMSSRNIRLSEEHRNKAGFIYKTLLQLKSDVKNMPLHEAIEKAKAQILKNEETILEYLEVTDPETLMPLNAIPINGQVLALVVVNYFGVRLLDNIFL